MIIIVGLFQLDRRDSLVPLLPPTPPFPGRVNEPAINLRCVAYSVPNILSMDPTDDAALNQQTRSSVMEKRNVGNRVYAAS